MKEWTSKKADKIFSEAIRARDGKCQRCGNTERLTNSHFWGRNRSSTRYSFENCIALCFLCHLFKWEHEKQGEYMDFMKKWLGLKGYKALEKLAHTTMSRRDAIKKLQSELDAKTADIRH